MKKLQELVGYRLLGPAVTGIQTGNRGDVVGDSYLALKLKD